MSSLERVPDYGGFGLERFHHTLKIKVHILYVRMNRIYLRTYVYTINKYEMYARMYTMATESQPVMKLSWSSL